MHPHTNCVCYYKYHICPVVISQYKLEEMKPGLHVGIKQVCKETSSSDTRFIPKNSIDPFQSLWTQGTCRESYYRIRELKPLPDIIGFFFGGGHDTSIFNESHKNANIIMIIILVIAVTI